MTRAEFESIAAEAMMREDGLDPETASPEDVYPYVLRAQAALGRVGAFEMLEELRNIATADPSKWEPDMRDQFKPWAQNRAASAIAIHERRS